MRLPSAFVLGLALLSGCPTPEPTDGGPVDGGSDADTRCDVDADCDDRRACNGVETCVASQCMAGAPVLCDDGIACTVDACLEEVRGCAYLAPDLDGDGYGAISCLDAEGNAVGDDCDDADADRFPGNVELCDPEGRDEDCDFSTRGGLDEDRDGFESAACCNPTEGGGTTCGDDCNDAVALVNPRGIEVCNLRDDDCDGMDDAAEGLTLSLYVDADRDGYGDGSAPRTEACVSQAGFSVNDGDCDDRPTVGVARSPGQPEFCDVVDNDCDTRVDEMTVSVPWYADADGDGFGDPSDELLSCTPIAGRSLLGTDCDDGASGRNPGVAELCNGLDDDCSGLADAPAGDGLEDDDLDGVADLLCGGALGLDCDDLSAAVGAGSSEICDGRDNDCDASFDEGVDMAVFYADRDGDGFGSIGSGAFVGCGAPSGFVAMAGDCADGDGERFPGSVEACNGRDDDCDGTADEAPATTACDVPATAIAAACRRGRCELTCDRIRGDCDGDYLNGCEANLTFDENHCGGCGVTCSNRNAVASFCGEQGCVAMCMPGFFDCVPSNDGCETTESTRDCGGCGIRCPSIPNADATCVAGSCGRTCRSGFFECDGNPSNGCESAGPCTLCPPGGARCDADAVCEDLFEDELNCGSCGRACGLGGSCLGGECDDIIDLAIGGRHTCALRSGGQVVCWGANDEGQADPTRPVLPLATPTIVTGIDDAIAITAGARHTCALRATGRVSCWGRNENGQLGIPGMPDLSFNASVLSTLAPVRSIEAGGDHTCAATAAEIYCWGENGARESAPASTANPAPPTSLGELLGLGVPSHLALGAGYTCFDTNFEVANCFGDVPNRGRIAYSAGNDWGMELEMGFGVSAPDVTSLEAGGTHVCITTTAGRVFCRGANDWRQLGSSVTGTTGPEVVEGTQLFGAVELWLGYDTTCARLALGQVLCLGGATYGEVGIGDGIVGGARSSAVAPNDLPRIRLLSRGSDDGHVCAVDLAGRTWCWGHNNDTGVAGAVHRLGLSDPRLVVSEPTIVAPLGY